MFKTIKRVLAIALVFAMALTVIGCKKEPTNVDANGDNKTDGGIDKVVLEDLAIDSDAVVASMPAELKNTKLVFLNWYNPKENLEKPVIAEFEKKTGIDIVCRVTDYGTYIQEVAKMLATNEQLDVMRMKQPDLAALKLLQPLSVTEYDFSDKAWDKYTMGLYSVGEKQYGAALRYTPYFLPTMIFYNKDVITDMGFEDPYELWKQGKWTWSKLREMCNTWVTENGAEYTGCSIWNGGTVSTAGAELMKLTDDGITYDLDLTNQLGIDCYKFMEEGKQMGLFTNVNDGFDSAKPKLLFAMHDASTVQISSEYFNKLKLRKQLMTVAMPKWDGTEGFDDYYVPMMENIAFGIPKTAKNPKAVPYFLAYVCNMANYNTGVGEGGFFFNEQTKEAYMELMSFEKRNFKITGTIASYDGTIKSFDWSIFMGVDPTQINSWLQEREYIIRASMELYNQDRLALK